MGGEGLDVEAIAPRQSLLPESLGSDLQEEMLGSVRDSGDAEWSVLIMDTITTKVMSSSCRISDVLDYGVSCEAFHFPIPP